MFKVTPIGSCRITGPLRFGQKSHGIDLNLTRCYGYCHSPAEAVQMARFMQGDIAIPEEIWPLVSRSGAHGALSRQASALSDLYFVELASAKELTVDGVSVQLNYLNSTYRDFFADPRRAATFWDLAQAGDAGELCAFLAQTWSATDAQRADAAVLGRLRLRFVTRDSLARDIRTLAELLPEVHFVSHVDAKKPDGQPIASRSDFIRCVDEAVTEAGLTLTNPTELMDEFGQAAAIEDHSTSLAHFTEEFSQALMDDWMRAVIGPLTDRPRRSKGRGRKPHPGVAPQVAAAIEHGRFAHLRSRLTGSAHGAGPLADILAEAARREGDAHRAFDRRFAALRGAGYPARDAAGLAEEAATLGLFDQALALAQAAEAELPLRVLTKAARLAADAGADDVAFAFCCLALERAPQLVQLRILAVAIAAKAPVPGFGALDEARVRHLVQDLPAARQIAVLRTQGVPVGSLVGPGTDAGTLAGFVACLAEDGALDQALDLMAGWRKAHKADRFRHPRLVALLDGWVGAAQSLPDALHRIEALSVIREADPRHQGLRRALQTHKADLVGRIRAAGKLGDIDAVEALGDEVSRFPAPLPEFDLWRARLRFKRGDYETVIELGQSAAIHLPETINVWVLLMRAAVRLQMQGKASEFAGKVIELASSQAVNLKAEAQAVLNAAGAEA